MLYAYTFLQFLSEIEFSVCRAGLRQTKRSVTKLLAEEKSAKEIRSAEQKCNVQKFGDHQRTKQQKSVTSTCRRSTRRFVTHKSTEVVLLKLSEQKSTTWAIRPCKGQKGIRCTLDSRFRPFHLSLSFHISLFKSETCQTKPPSLTRKVIFGFSWEKLLLSDPCPKTRKSRRSRNGRQGGFHGGF